jgi:fimbrial isopeptide formation D2 family protein/uncharacterized repeat protein (TIGR01451 family)
MAAKPVVSFLSGAAVSAPIGGVQTVTLRFDNQPDAAAGSNVGYSPYVSLVIPSNGTDGAGVGSSGATQNDGVTLLGATYLGQPVQAFAPVEFDATGKAIHPFATNAAGGPLILTGSPGDTLLVLRLPFGSFTPDQTPADIELRLQVSNLADLGAPLTLQATGGFAYGRDPLLNPVADNPVVGQTTSLSVTPTIIALDKVYLGPEQETATGPSYPRSWLVEAEIASGQTVTNLVLTDRMPDGTFITGASIVNGTGTVSFDNATGLVVATLTGAYTGGVGGVPTLKIDFYVPEFLRDGVTPVLDPVTGAFRVLENNARLDATWQPVDGRDPLQVFAIDPVGPEDVITAKSIAVQKSVAVVDALKAGGTLEWKLDGQVSNYFDMDDLVLTDTLGDGQVFKAGFTPTLVVREGGATIFQGTLSGENVVVTRDLATGLSTIRFNVSAELRKAGLDDVLNGQVDGRNHQATVLVTFRSTIEERYEADSNLPSGEPLVDQGDPIGNEVDFDGVVDQTDRPRGDDSGAGVRLPVSEVAKSIHAINGSTTFGSTVVQAGDTLTFRLKLDMPLTGAHEVALTDYLPLPVLDLAAKLDWQNMAGSGIPASGFAKWGPAATAFANGAAAAPVITFNDASNSLRFDFGDVVKAGNPASSIDILFTVTVLDREFGDGLLLTNQVTSTETNSFGQVFEDNAIVQFTLGEPELRISKGVVADSNPDAQPTGPIGPVTFTAPGTAGNRFGTKITSDGLKATPIDADLTGADAGDRVTFAIVVENTGSAPRGAFDVLIRDTLPPGFEIPPGGLNLRVTDGAGNVQAFTLRGNGLFDPAGGIELVDQAGAGSIGAYSATSGENILVITYDLELADDAPVFGADLVNTARIENVAAKEGGIDRADFIPTADVSDTAFVRTALPLVTKTVVATSEAHTGKLAGRDALDDLTIGETATYRITVTLPQGSLKSFRIEDLLPVAGDGGVMTVTGARFIGAEGLGAGSVFDTTPTITFADRDGRDGNDKVTFDFGDVVNAAGTPGSAPATVTVEVDARLRDLPANAAGDVLRNTAIVSAQDPDVPAARVTATATADIEVVAPNLDLAKTANRTSADASDLVTYTLTVENKGVPASGNGGGNFTARAWDVSLKDAMADLLKDASLVGGTLKVTITAAGQVVPNASQRITVSSTSDIDVLLSYLDPGEKVTLTFDVVVKADVDAGEQLNNAATVTGSTMDDTGGPDDRIATDVDDHRVTISAPSVVKTIVSTSGVNTGSDRYSSSVTDVRIGEEITYEIRVHLPEGDSPNLRITDTLEDLLSAGDGTLTYVPDSLQVVSVGSRLQSFTGQPVGAPTLVRSNPGSTLGDDRFVLSFGDIRNTAQNGANTGDAEETIILRIKAVVNDLPQNAGADTLTNTASADTGTTGTPSSNGSGSVFVEVVEPDLIVDKTSSIAPGQTLDAGDIIRYSVTIRHSQASAAPAYDLALADVIPAGMVLVPGKLTASIGDVAVTDGVISWSLGQFLRTDTAVTITYEARLLDAVTPGQLLSNTARLTYDTNPADPVDPLNPTQAEDLASRSYTRQDTETRTVSLTPTIDKSVVATGDVNTGSSAGLAANPDAAPGETVQYRLTVTLGEGTQRLVVSDALPPGLLFGSAAVERIGATIGGSALAVGAGPTSVSGGSYSFDFGTVVNGGDNDRDAGDTVTILVNARVAPGAASGSTLINTARAETFGPGAGKPGAAVAVDDAAIDVVRPDLVIDKSADRAVVDGGDVITYTITLGHAPGSTSAAYLLNLSDLLPPGVSLVVDSARASAGAVSEAGGNVSWTLGQYVLGAAPVTITYQARAAAGVVDGQVLNNTAQLTYASAPSAGASVKESDGATVRVDIVNAIAKTLEATSLATTAGNAVGIGEEVTFLVTTTLGEGVQHIRLADVLPTGLDYLSSSLVSLGGITGSALGIGAAGSYDAANRTVAFNLGNVVNPWDNASTAADQVVFRVVAKVADTAANTAGKQLVNLGQLTSSVPANSFGVPAGSGVGTVSDAEAVAVVRASLGGIAWRDTDGDGIRGSGEGPVPGIAVALLDADGVPTGRTATTAADGSYVFDGLVPGTYRVRFDETAAERRTLANRGGDDTRDSDAAQGSGVTGPYTVASGDDLRGIDAGFYLPASIGDRVWQDTNGDGIQNDGTTGIGGITVNLLRGDGTPTGRSTVTSSNGAYSFGDLAPGEYRIEVVAPGYAATKQNAGDSEAADSDIAPTFRSDAFTLTSGQVERRVDAGLYLPAKLAGTLFEDVDGDGVQDPGEGGVASRTVTLLDANGISTGETRTTDSEGNYLFTGLAPGSYSVVFAASAAAPFTRQDQGGDDLRDSDAAPATGRTQTVTLVSGAEDRSLDAGVYLPARIGDFVWEDVDGDGLQGTGEAGIAGATVRLRDAGGALLSTTVTGADGGYLFQGLAPGDYIVQVSKAGFVPTARDAGADALDSDIGADGRTEAVTLSSGETDRTVDAGLYRPASIGDRVFLDADNDGVQDAGEAGVDGVTVCLLSADGLRVLGTDVTADGGIYGFGDLAPGSYVVEFVAPSALAFGKRDQGASDAADSDADRVTGRTGPITLRSGEARSDVDAGLVELGDLAGRVWIDRDGDGLEERGEAPRAGVTVQLLDRDGVPTGRTTTTEADGTYLFRDVLAGEYRVAFVVPDGLRITLRDRGGNDAVDSDADATTGVTGLVTIRPAELTGDVDAGLYEPGSIGDRVWHDLDADGVQDTGEPGLAGVRVSLLDGSGTVIRTTATDAQGRYGFDDLAPEKYAVRLEALPGFEFSPAGGTANQTRDSDVDAGGTTRTVKLFSGQMRTDLDAGQFQRVALGDRVWLDADGNGVQDPGEAGARGVTVRLLDAGGALVGTTVTDALGGYGFAGLLPGSYAVQFVAPPGTALTARDVGLDDASDSDADRVTGVTRTVTLTSGRVDGTLDAGLLRTASIGDRVWADRDGDGRQDSEEPGIAGARVRLVDAGGAVIATTVTDGSGFYQLDGLLPGTYAVEFVTPAGHAPAPQNVGSDLLDSDAGAGGRTSSYTLGQGQLLRTVDAGFVPAVVGACDLPTRVLTAGNDGFPGTEAPDHVDGLAGDDNINGLRGEDCLRGNDGDDAINGHEGNDRIQGDAGNDNLHGNAGDDVIYGGNGHDTIEAGEGADWAEGGNGDDDMQGEGGNDTLFGGAGRDTVVGNAGDDVVLGRSGSDMLAGHDGADTLVGGVDLGRATLSAGRITGLVLGDTISGDAGADRFIWQNGDGVDLLLDFKPADGDTLTIYGFAAFTAVERIDGRTVLYLGTDAAIVLNDAYPATGTAGPFPGVTFVPGSRTAPDLPTERAPRHGTSGDDTLTGSSLAERIEALQGADRLSGLGGNDTLDGGDGADTLLGGEGADRLEGGADTDLASYEDATAGVVASLAAPAGNSGSAAGDVYELIENLRGSAFADRLGGDGAANRLEGGAGDDTLSGGAGNDTLFGAAGADSLSGGAGADRFFYRTLGESAPGSADRLADFSWAEGDLIDLSAIDANAGQSGNQAFVFVGAGSFLGGGQGSVRWQHAGGDTLVEVDAGNGGAAEMEIRLVGLQLPLAGDFIL